MPQDTVLPCLITSAHVDWLTCTAKDSDRQGMLWDISQRLFHPQEAENQHPTTWHAHGYRGWQSPGVRFGRRGDSSIVQLSGAKSADHWEETVAASENCSRIDLAVDSHF